MALVQGGEVTIFVETSEAICSDEDDPVTCVDVSGRTFDYHVEGLADGMSVTFDTSLQSPSTPGLVRMTVQVAASVVPDLYELAIHALLDGRPLGKALLEVHVLGAELPFGLDSIADIEGGATHSVAVLTNDTAVSFGGNDYGQLGDGTRTARNSPVPVLELTGIVDVSASVPDRPRTLWVLADGTVWAAGYAGDGLLFDGRGNDVLVPRQIPGLADIVQVAAGGRHTLAASADGTVFAWGANESGQLGNGTFQDSSVPTAVPAVADVVDVAAGLGFSIVRRADGTVWSWGRQSALGRMGPHLSPAPVEGIDNAIAVAVGSVHVLALLDDGTVVSWGDNAGGQLGDGTTEDRQTPVAVPSLANVTAIAAGAIHSLALRSDGTVWGFGFNGSGQLLVEEDHGRRQTVPAQIPGLSDIVAIGAGRRHSLALSACGQLWSFGENDAGALGTGGNSGSDRLRLVAGTGRPGGCSHAALTIVLAGEGTGIVETSAGQFTCTTNDSVLSSCLVYDTLPVEANTNVTLEATALDNSLFSGWSGDCQGASPILTASFDGPALCVAHFDSTAAEAFLVSAIASGGRVVSTLADTDFGPLRIDCGEICAAVFSQGSEPTLTAMPEPGHAFVGWGDDCSGMNPQTSVVVDGNKTCRADFEAFAITVQVSGEGSVTSDPMGIQCPSGSCTFEPGTSPITLSAAAASGWSFSSWGGDCSGTDASIMVVMDADKVCVANFAEAQAGFTLSVTILNGAGKVVSVEPSAVIQCDTADPVNSVCSAVFAPGTLVRLADGGVPGTFFGGWPSGCDTITASGECEVTLNADTEVVAFYE